MPEKLDSIHKSIVKSLSGKTNPKTKKPYTEQEMWAIAQAQYKKSEGKENKFCPFGILETKEDEQNFHAAGFVATNHPDRACADGFEGDIIPINTLHKIAEQINNRYNPEAGAVSESHDWIKSKTPEMPLAGVVFGPAEVKPTPDGRMGVFVDTIISKTNPRYEQVKTNIEQGVYPGFSIEYDTNDFSSVLLDGKPYRQLDDITMRGFGFANRRLIANPHAEIVEYGFKEIVEQKEEHKPVPEKPEDKSKELQGENKMEEVKKEGVKEIPSMKEVSNEEYDLLQKFKADEIAKKEAIRINGLVEAQIKEMVGKSIPSLNVNPQLKVTQFKEIQDHPYHLANARMKELDVPMQSNEHRKFLHRQIVNLQYKEAAKMANGLIANGAPLFNNWLAQSFSGELYLKNKNVQEVANRLEIKETALHNIEMKSGEGLQMDTNLAHASWTYGSYYQSPVELNDIYGQALVNQLNDQTVTWGKLTKEDWSGRSQIQIRARTGRNSTAGGYAEGANLTYASSFTGTVGRQKFQQPFCYYRVLVAVTGQEIAFARAPGGIGDIWADEIKWSGADLQRVLNQAIIGTGDGTSESTSLGFEGLILGTTSTLYGKSIATYTTLKSHKESCSGRIDLDQIRKMIDYCQAGDGSTITNSNANKADLVVFTSFTQRRFLYSLIQSMQRTVPTSARVGYEGEPEIDGVPIFADPHINADDVFMIDTAHTKIGINVPPTIEALPVTADAKAAQIKIYFNLYSDAPSNNYWAYGFATS